LYFTSSIAGTLGYTSSNGAALYQQQYCSFTPAAMHESYTNNKAAA